MLCKCSSTEHITGHHRPGPSPAIQLSCGKCGWNAAVSEGHAPDKYAAFNKVLEELAASRDPSRETPKPAKSSKTKK